MTCMMMKIARMMILNLTKPLAEMSVLEEIIELLVLLVIIGIIWLIGQAVYQLEKERERKNNDRKHD